MHRDKELHVWRHVLCLNKLKLNCLTRMSLVMFGGKRPEKHHPDCETRGCLHRVVGLFCCRRDWCTSQNRCIRRKEHYVEKLKQHQHIRRKLKQQMGLQMDNDLKHTAKLVTKRLKDNKEA
ncbi:hypothetical protein NQD34_002136 [Periophthalmus magnuspinnatus]|nr:hypothetical protein NQD34_002136 [Periophthalmus magnuspinnatus]